MSRTGLRKSFAYVIAVAGAALTMNGITKLSRPDKGIAFMLFGGFLLFLVPVIVFGASIQVEESALKISQYKDVTLGFEEIRGCYRYFFPPFSLVLITTTRRFPLCILIEMDGTIGHRGTLAEKVRSRIRRSV
jgi:hypothetical protein